MITEHEKYVLSLASQGLRNREMAVVLGISHTTVKTELSAIRDKLNAKNTAHAVAEAIRGGLID